MDRWTIHVFHPPLDTFYFIALSAFLLVPRVLRASLDDTHSASAIRSFLLCL